MEPELKSVIMRKKQKCPQTGLWLTAKIVKTDIYEDIWTNLTFLSISISSLYFV